MVSQDEFLGSSFTVTQIDTSFPLLPVEEAVFSPVCIFGNFIFLKKLSGIKGICPKIYVLAFLYLVVEFSFLMV